jgi:hypothetical protein
MLEQQEQDDEPLHPAPKMCADGLTKTLKGGDFISFFNWMLSKV